MTRPGPSPVPTHLKLLRGNPGKEKLNKDEPQPAVPETIPEAPEFLGAYAKEEWNRVIVELHRLRLCTVVDLSLLATYCQSYQVWRDACELVEQIKGTNNVHRGLIIRERNGDIVRNPVIDQMHIAARQMIRIAGEFGFSPAARSRINAGAWAELPRRSKFDGLIGPA